MGVGVGVGGLTCAVDGMQDETGVCKNLLQETAQRAGVSLPVYATTRSGPGHLPVFTCTVEVASMTFSGEAAKTKKQAEKNAAMAAWSALKQCEWSSGECECECEFECEWSEMGGWAVGMLGRRVQGRELVRGMGRWRGKVVVAVGGSWWRRDAGMGGCGTGRNWWWRMWGGLGMVYGGENEIVGLCVG